MNLTRNLANPEQIFEVVNDIFIQTEVQRLSEQRICERKPIFKSIELQFLNKDLDPVGPAIEAITRDVSVGGVGIISPILYDAGHAMIHFKDLSEETPSLLVEIRYTQQLGPFFQIGGRFCADWSSIEFS